MRDCAHWFHGSDLQILSGSKRGLLYGFRNVNISRWVTGLTHGPGCCRFNKILVTGTSLVNGKREPPHNHNLLQFCFGQTLHKLRIVFIARAKSQFHNILPPKTNPISAKLETQSCVRI